MGRKLSDSQQARTEFLNQEDQEYFIHHLAVLRHAYAGWWVFLRNRTVVDADRDLHLLSLRQPGPRGYLGFVDGLPVSDDETVRKALGR